MTREAFVTEGTRLGMNEEAIKEILLEANQMENDGDDYPYELVLLSRSMPPLTPPHCYPPLPIRGHL